MITQVAIIPIGQGVSLGEYVAKAVGIIDKSGLKYKVENFGTTIEGEWDEVMKVVKECRNAVMKDAGRVLTYIIIDGRSDLEYKINDKINSVERHLGRQISR